MTGYSTSNNGVSRPLRVAGIARVSTIHQAEKGLSLEDQHADMVAACARNGYEMVKVLEDRAVSGRIRDRPAIRELDAMVLRGEIDLVMMVHLDRLGRQTKIILDHLASFTDAGLKFLVLHGNLRGETDEEWLTIGVLSSIAEYAERQARKRFIAGRHRKAATGFYPSYMSLLGYHTVLKWEAQADPSLHSGQLVVIEEEADLVRRIFAEFAGGTGIQVIAQRLMAEGVRGRKGAPMTYHSLQKLLTQSAYKGELIYGKHRSETSYPHGDERQVRKIKPLAPEHWHRIAVPAIVSVEVWEKVQELLKKRFQPPPGRPTESFPLRGCVACDTCISTKGKPLQAAGGRRTQNRKSRSYDERYYRCPRCYARAIARTLEPRALAYLRRSVQPEAVEQLAAKLKEEPVAAKGMAKGLRVAESALQRLEAEEQRVLDGLRLGASRSGVEKQLTIINERRVTIQAQWERICKEALRVQQAEHYIASLHDWAAQVRENLATLDEEPTQIQDLFRRHIRVRLVKGGAPKIELVLPEW